MSSKMGVSSKPASSPTAPAEALDALAEALDALADAEALLACALEAEPLAEALLDAEPPQAAKPRQHAMAAATAKQAISLFTFLVCSIFFSLS